MSACYWVLGTDSIFHDGSAGSWPDTLRLASPETLARYPVRPSAPHTAPSDWRLVEDDDAPPELDGKEVSVILHMVNDVPGIGVRNEVIR